MLSGLASLIHDTGAGPDQGYRAGELSVPPNTCHARTDLAVRLRNR